MSDECRPPRPGSPQPHELRVLVVDDEDVVRELLERFLIKRGYVVSLAKDGRAGLELFRKIPFDLVLSDVRMPGIDGLQLMQAVKELNPRVPVVLISGYGDVETVVRALKAGAENFLSKPVRLEQLEQVVERSLALSCIRPRPSLVLPEMEQITSFTVPSRSDLVCELVYQIALSAVAVGFARNDLDNNVRLALVEALTNAMEHGNRWDETKQVRVQARISRDTLQVSVGDEGPGFDHHALADPTASENLLSERGRGIFLMRSIMDQVSFSPQGNSVVLTKHRQGDPPAEAAFS